MAVKVAEYFGQKTEDNPNVIQPITGRAECPFMNSVCVKLAEGKKPICVVRQSSGELWIVCRHRLCATKRVEIKPCQKETLMEVAKFVYGDDILPEDIGYKQEVAMPVVKGSTYSADYIMKNMGPRGRSTGQRNIVLEMQGGGETSKTGSITRHVHQWENSPMRTNEMLATFVDASPIVTNAWRRQQEQFIIKGNIAQITGGGMVFCVGVPLYDYLWARVQSGNLMDLKAHNWTLAILAFKEVVGDSSPFIKFEIDSTKAVFTNYVSFVQLLINQGKPNPEMFEGKFDLLSGGNSITYS